MSQNPTIWPDFSLSEAGDGAQISCHVEALAS